MRSPLYILLIFLLASSFILPPQQSNGLENLDLEIMQTIMNDSDFQSYINCGNCMIYPISLKHGDKAYILSDSTSHLQEIPLNSINPDSSLILKSLRYKNINKVKIKLKYLDKKLNLTARRTCQCCGWEIRTFLAREAGDWKPHLFILK